MRKRGFLVVAGVILLLAPALLFASGGKEGAASGTKQVVIGAAMAQFSDYWLSFLDDGVMQIEKTYPNAKVIMTDGQNDPAKQLNDVQSLIAKGVNAIVIVPVDISALQPVIDACKKAKIPLVTVNRLPEKDLMDQIDVYVGGESIQSGILETQWVYDHMPNGGKVGILMGQSGHEAARNRTAGTEQVLAKNSKFEIVSKAAGDWDRARAQSIVEDWLQKGKYDAIISNNDEMAIGAILAIKEKGLVPSKDIIVAGIDGSPAGLSYLGNGLNVTVFQDAYGQGYGGALAAYKIVTGEKVPKMDYIPYELVTVADKAKYEAKWPKK